MHRILSELHLTNTPRNLNFPYTHAEAYYNPARCLHIIWRFVVRLTLRPLYPIMSMCMSWIVFCSHPVIFRNLVCLFLLSATDAFSRNIALCTMSTIWEPLSLCQALVFNEVYLWRHASYKNFLAVYLAPYPPPQSLQRGVIYETDPKSLAKTQAHMHAHTLCARSHDI